MDRQSILVIDSDKATHIWLGNLLISHDYRMDGVQSGREGLEKLSAYSGGNIEIPNLLIIDLELVDMTGEEVINSFRNNPILGEIPIVVFSKRQDLLEISRLFQMGISDYVTKKPGIENELLGKISSSILRSQTGDAMKEKGKLISFFSAKGGTGTSTLCLNLAHCLAENVDPKKVLVVDLVLPIGSIAIMTGTLHENSIANMTAEVKPHDTQKLKTFLLPVENWSVSILPGSESVEESQKLEPSRIVPILNSLLRAFDYVFVDLGKTLSTISQSVMNFSDLITVVVSPDLLTAELTQIALKHLIQLGIDQDNIFMIMNRAVGLAGLTKLEMEDKIGQTIQRTVPYARENFTLTTNKHKPYTSQFKNDGISIELQNLAEMLE